MTGVNKKGPGLTGAFDFQLLPLKNAYRIGGHTISTTSEQFALSAAS
jgi:hypothetical protein